MSHSSTVCIFAIARGLSYPQQNVRSTFCVHYRFRQLPNFQTERSLFEGRLHPLSSKESQIAAPLGRRAIRFRPCELLEGRSEFLEIPLFFLQDFQETLQFFVGFLFGLCNFGVPPGGWPFRAPVLFQNVQDTDFLRCRRRRFFFARPLRFSSILACCYWLILVFSRRRRWR